MADAGTAKLPGGGWDYPPFGVYGDKLQNTEDKGKAYEVGSIVCYSLAAVAAGGAVYLWLNHFGVIGSKEKATKKKASVVVPVIGKGTAGVGYGLKF